MLTLPTLLSPTRLASSTALGPDGAIALYRLPHEATVRLRYRRTPAAMVRSIAGLQGRTGFVAAPFSLTNETPIVLIEGEESTISLPAKAQSLAFIPAIVSTDEAERRQAYARSFERVKERLRCGEADKIVLSRRLSLDFAPQTDAGNSADATPWAELIARGTALFLRACAMKPESFVAFWWSPISGAWLTATPEPILEQTGGQWHTVALAGTRSADDTGGWSAKNREEQAIVARFVGKQLDGLATSLEVSPVHDLRTGPLLHRCTDFRFRLPQGETAALSLLTRLHPTPAVAGTPRERALAAILADEDTPRRYYAGFCGPYAPTGDTHLYVSLRCLELHPHSATLYAGGGIMPESNEADEWDETCRKLRTMRGLFEGLRS